MRSGPQGTRPTCRQSSGGPLASRPGRSGRCRCDSSHRGLPCRSYRTSATPTGRLGAISGANGVRHRATPGHLWPLSSQVKGIWADAQHRLATGQGCFGSRRPVPTTYLPAADCSATATPMGERSVNPDRGDDWWQLGRSAGALSCRGWLAWQVLEQLFHIKAEFLAGTRPVPAGRVPTS